MPVRGLRGVPASPVRRELGLQCLGCLKQIISQQSRLRVAYLGLNDNGLACHFRLPAQRLELPSDFVDQVRQPVEVCFARLELADGFLLAFAMLEYARGFFDEATTTLRRRLQDRIELSLAHDDVHLSPDAGVTEQLVDIQQSCHVAVDGVLGSTVAEHRPRNRYLGIVDGQGTVRVVNREYDLGATERGATGGAGEDDVLHLSAA